MSCAQVEEWTAVVESSIPSKLKHAPNAKMFLRSFWYRAMINGNVAQEEMHIYALARCTTFDCCLNPCRRPTIAWPQGNAQKLNQHSALQLSASAFRLGPGPCGLCTITGGSRVPLRVLLGLRKGSVAGPDGWVHSSQRTRRRTGTDQLLSAAQHDRLAVPTVCGRLPCCCLQMMS